MNLPYHFIVNDIPFEWRAAIDKVEIPERILPKVPEKSVAPQSLTSILIDDPTLQNVPIALDKTEILLHSASVLQNEIKKCRLTLESAEKKRREVASNAELIHGECDSQISSEQRLTIFVKSIDSILHYFEDLDKISLDFKSPLFNVLSPDFPSNLQKIEGGIRFFQMNQNYKDAQSYLYKYQALQSKAIDVISNYISTTLSQITHKLSMNQTKLDDNIYIKFISVAPSIRRLFVLSEKTSAFGTVLSIYRNSRMTLLKPFLSQPITSSNEIRSRASTILTVARKEYELAHEFFDFNGHPLYIKCFCELIGEIGSIYHDTCYSLLLKVNDIKDLCNTCIVLKGDVLQEEISRIPIAAEKLRTHFIRILNETQERLIYRSKILSTEIKGDATKTVELLSLLYYALPRESFGECAYTLIKNCLNGLDELSKKKYGNAPTSTIERDSFLLGNLLILHDRIKNFDCQIVGKNQSVDIEPLSEFLWRVLHFDMDFLKNRLEMSRISNPYIDSRKELDSATSISFHSLTDSATNILFSPLLNIQQKKINDKKQILNEINKVEKLFDENVKQKITSVIDGQIKPKPYKDAVIDVLRSHLKQVVLDVMTSIENIDDETQESFNLLIQKVSQISI